MDALKMNSKGEYVYYSQDLGKATKIHVYYHKGGMNAFSGGRIQRGVYISIMPVELQQMQGIDSRVEIASVTEGIRACVMPLKRANASAVELIASRLDCIVRGIALGFCKETKKVLMQEMVDFVTVPNGR